MIPSLLDTDHYKITMGQVIFHYFPRTRAHYRFHNRAGTAFPEGFANGLRAQIDRLADLQATAEEIAWLQRTVRYLKPTYLEWLAHYRFNPTEVTVQQQDGKLDIDIVGPWYRTVFWEVPLMALVSELYFAGRRPAEDWQQRIVGKAERMAGAGVHWVDFGTRRRFAYTVQDKVNEIMRRYRPLFMGTSNPHFAMKYDLVPMGTYAHEGPMAMQALSGVVTCNEAWMDAWVREYEGDLGIALTDTVTSAHFFRTFGLKETKLFDGIRQDSGLPPAIADMALRHYQGLNIDPRSKRIIFSDSLDDNKLIALHEQFSERILVTGGIGTFLTNDVGHKPLNMVIKLAAVDFGHGWKPVVKLSDDPGKYSGEPERIAAALVELGLDVGGAPT
jgi:nicotinate phosphoribosyltransferase